MAKQFPSWVLALLICFIWIVNAIANYWHLYFYIWWLDIPMHMLGGLWIGLFLLTTYYRKALDASRFSALLVSMGAVVVTTIAGIGWEVFEYYFNNMAAALPFDLLDTLSDIGNDFIGAGSAAAIFSVRGYNKVI